MKHTNALVALAWVGFDCFVNPGIAAAAETAPAPTGPAEIPVAAPALSPRPTESVAPKPTESVAPKPTESVAPKPPPAPAQAPKNEEHRVGFEECAGAGAGASDKEPCSGVFGLRSGITHSNVSGTDDAIGLTLSVQGEVYRQRGLWSTRNRYQLAIGGGAAGFEGTLLGGWAGGVRLPLSVSGRHGPVLRLGMYGYLLGNEAFYGSLLELPQIQVGYQYQFERTLIEFGVTSGAVLVGRSRIGNTGRRVLGSGFEYGAYAAVQLRWLRLGVSASRLPTNDAWDQPFDVLEGTLCGRVRVFAICSDARLAASKAPTATGGGLIEARSVYAGITLGVTGE